jgi:DNA modification methylase
MQLIHGDCLEKMKDIPDKYIDMILCDLPYGTTSCKWDVVIPFEPLWEQYKRIIKDNGAIVLFGSEPFSSALRMSNIHFYRYDLKWQKDQGSDFMMAKRKPLKDYEDIAVFYKKQPTYNPQMREGFKEWTKKDTGKNTISHLGKQEKKQIKQSIGGKRYPISILKFNRIRNGLHSTQKPVDLLEYLIKTYTKENETVLDNCMGSGSTGVACVNTKRNFIGIEKDDKYFEIAKKRIEEHLTTCST